MRSLFVEPKERPERVWQNNEHVRSNLGRRCTPAPRSSPESTSDDFVYVQ